MKKILYVVISLIVVFTTVYYLMRIVGKNNDKVSKAYIDNVVPKIMSNWDFLEIEKYASPEMKRTLNLKTGISSFKMFGNKYGKFIKYGGSEGESVRYFTVKGIIMTAEYQCNVIYEHGVISLVINLIRHDGEWQILQFNLKP
jgi:hypothetical protein